MSRSLLCLKNTRAAQTSFINRRSLHLGRILEFAVDNTMAYIHSGGESDEDSAWTTEAASSLYSLESWVEKNRLENGRRYHSFKDGAYLLPNDEKELDRLDLHHHITLLMLDGKLHLAPAENPRRVLDIGTGTGIWAIDLADSHPESSVIGVDLSAVQPKWIPPNLEFQIDDVEDSWNFHGKFDFIFIRSMSGAISDWPRLLSEAFRYLNAGGWVELQEHEAKYQADDDSLSRTPNINRWIKHLHAAGDKINKPLLVMHSIAPKLKEAGFVNVHQKVQKVPHGPWMEDKQKKVIGIYQREQMLEAAGSYGTAHFTRVLGWSNEEYQILNSRVRKEMRDESLKLYSDLYVIYGQKPLEN